MNPFSFLNRRFILPVLVLITLLVLVAPAGASAPPHVKWRLDVLVDGSEFKAERVNEVWRNGNLLLQWVDPVPCIPNGAVTIANGIATFAGGYVECDMPDLQLSVWDATNQRLLIGPTCQAPLAKNNIWVTAELANVNMVASSRHPIFSHPDYDIHFAVENAGGGQFTATEEAGLMSTTSNTAGLLSSFSLGARIHQCNPGSGVCTGRHFLNGLSNGVETIGISSVSGPTGPTTVFLGSDGVDQFYGDFMEGHLDPGCIATQG